MSAREDGAEYIIELPEGTPEEQLYFLMGWVANVINHPDLSPDAKRLGQALANEVAQQILEDLSKA